MRAETFVIVLFALVASTGFAFWLNDVSAGVFIFMLSMVFYLVEWDTRRRRK